MYSEYQEAQKMDSVEKFPRGFGFSDKDRMRPLIQRAIADERMKHEEEMGYRFVGAEKDKKDIERIDTDTDDEDISGLVDSILGEMELRRRAAY